jgi:hypothetical protein
MAAGDALLAPSVTRRLIGEFARNQGARRWPERCWPERARTPASPA